MLRKRYHFRKKSIAKSTPKKEVQLWEQRLFGYIGVLLAAASLFLAYVVFNQETKIEGMQALMRTQNEQIQQLAKLNGSSQKQIQNLAQLQQSSLKQIQAINYQTEFVKTNTKPEIGFVGVGLDSIGNNRYRYTIRLKNFGGRTALSLTDKFSFFHKTEKGYEFLFSSQDTKTNFPASDMKAGQELNTRSEFESNSQGILKFKNCFVVLQTKYKDALTGKVIYPEPIFIQNLYNSPYTTYIEAMEEDKVALRKLIVQNF